jgi:hypothetical protein
MITNLLNSNDALAEELARLGKKLLNDSPDELERIWTSYYTRLRVDIPKSFRKLHSHLCFIPAPWPRPEVDLFVRRILEAAGYKAVPFSSTSAPWQLLLTGEYNFSDILIHEYSFLDPLYMTKNSERDPLSDISRLRGILTIPAVEKENPLSWPNLVHELSHSLGKNHGLVEKARCLPGVKKFQDKDQLIYNQLREHWVPEIVADLIATDMLGIGYYVSFVTFATYWVQKSVWIPEATHPPVEARRHYIFQRLDGLRKITADFEKMLNHDYNVRLTLDNAEGAVRDELYDVIAPKSREKSSLKNSDPDWVKELEGLAKEISELDEYKAIFSSPGGPSDINPIKKQVETLHKGWLIAGKREKTVLKTEWPEAELGTPEMLKEAKLQLIECANDVRDIMISALLNKLLSDNNFLIQFCNNEEKKPIRTQLIDLWPYIHNHDVIITKSIEGSEIVRFYQTHEAFHK